MENSSAAVAASGTPQVQTGSTFAAPEQAGRGVKKLIVAVHGVGDQYSYATLQSVVTQFCRHYNQPMSVPLGAFHNDKPVFSVEDDDPDTPLSTIAFAEVYWATIPQELVANRHTLEEAKKWATTIVERLRFHWRRADKPVRCDDAAFTLSSQILHEMIETIAVAERLCFIADKAGLFTFDLRKILEDYLGDVQVVAEFKSERTKILAKFRETLEKASVACPDAEIYIVAHSEGTVVSLLGLLDGFRTSAAWAGQVRGLMTLGSPIDKHLYFWPSLFGSGSPSLRPESPIRWRNYYDEGDPIGFELDAMRAWLRAAPAHANGTTWQHVFEFERKHDIGFTRYPFPGKAHVDYWTDDAVFAHFIRTVVEAGDTPVAATSAVTSATGEIAAFKTAPPPPETEVPQTRAWIKRLSWIVPYVGVFALMVIAAFIITKAVLMADGHENADVSLILACTVGLATLLFGITTASRIPRLSSGRRDRLVAWGVGLASVVGCLWSWGALPADSRTWHGLTIAQGVVPLPSLAIIVAAATVVGLSSWIGTARPQWGAKPMILIGVASLAACVYEIVRSRQQGPTWPLLFAGAAFLYLWWLAALLFDLIVVWHVYIKSSRINETIRQMITKREDYESRQAREGHTATPAGRAAAASGV